MRLASFFFSFVLQLMTVISFLFGCFFGFFFLFSINHCNFMQLSRCFKTLTGKCNKSEYI